MTTPLSKEQLTEIATQSQETKKAAEKVENVLKESAQLLVDAKESMIIAMLKENLDVELISIATKTPVEKVKEIQLRLS